MSTETTKTNGTSDRDEEAKAAAAAAANEADDRDDEDDDADENDSDPPSSRGRKSASAAGGSTETAKGLGLGRASSAKIIATIAKRELAAYFNSPLAYIVISVSLVVLGGYFFFYKGGFWQVDRASMVRMFEIMPPALCLFTIPLFTMRALSDEKRVGTIELLITMPVKDSEVILGKYVASLTMVLVQVALVAVYPIAMFWGWHLGAFDWGPFWTGMFGLALLASAGTALGLAISGHTDSQILSYFLTAIVLLFFYFMGQASLVEYLQGPLGDVLAFVSLQTRFDPFARGLVDTRAVVYFVSLATLCLLWAFRTLESRKWS